MNLENSNFPFLAGRRIFHEEVQVHGEPDRVHFAQASQEGDPILCFRLQDTLSISTILMVRSWTVSFLLLATSFFMRTRYTDDADYWHLVLPLLIQDMALSVFLISLITICLEGVPHNAIPAASGIVDFVRITGSGFAASP